MLVSSIFSFTHDVFKIFLTTIFSTLSKTEIIILATFNLSSANVFSLDKSKILLFRKEFNTNPNTKIVEKIAGKRESPGYQ